MHKPPAPTGTFDFDFDRRHVNGPSKSTMLSQLDDDVLLCILEYLGVHDILSLRLVRHATLDDCGTPIEH